MQTSRVLVASIDVPSSGQPGEGRDGTDETRIARIASMQEAIARELAGRLGVRSWAFSDATPGDGRFERRGRVEGDGMPPDFPGLPVVTSRVEAGLLPHPRHRAPPRADVRPGRRPLPGRSGADPGPREREVPRPPGHGLPQRRGANDAHLRPGRGAHRPVDGDRRRGAPTWRRAWGRPSSTARRWPTCPQFRAACIPSPWCSISATTRPPSRPVLRRLIADADPTAILGDVVALDQLPNTAALVQRTASGILVGLSLIAIVLSTAALYALMSFTVARRTRGDRRAHRPRREIEPDRRVDRASIAPPTHVRGHARYRVLGHGLHAARVRSARSRASSGSPCGRGRTCCRSRRRSS